ncbi:hypothetical protein AMK10_07025 [Streptomyces sp. CB02058]|nr:hypothetical protein AMK10_07025 [Streptomyces sp. CB02058]
MFGVYGAGGRRGAAAVGCAAMALAVLTGCGEGAGEKPADGRGTAGKSPAASRPASPAGGLDEAQLTAVAFTDGERVGGFTASEYTLDGPIGDAYTATPAVCQPLVSLAGDVSDHEPTAQVQRKVDKPSDIRGVTVDVTLRSYAGDGAAEVMTSLGRAGEECAGGLTEERAFARGTYEKVEPVTPPAFAEADEVKAYRFSILDVKGKLKLHEYLTVVRSGSTTLAFRGEVLGTTDFGGIPEAVTTAQWKKFRAGQA